MASKIPIGIPGMIVQYEWNFEDVDKKPKTIASKMILFRGQKVFRVGLKNLVEKPVLFFMAVDPNKIGLKVEGVTCGIEFGSGIGPPFMWQMKNEITDNDVEGRPNLQLFKMTFDKQFVEKCTFMFRIHVVGSVSGYSYQLSDRLAKDQLWEAAKNKNLVDVELVVKDKKFFAHKAILAARSQVFVAEFTKKQTAGDQVTEPSLKKRKTIKVLHQIQLDDVEPSTVEQFLHFIYTGEPMETLANEELLKLAGQYKLATLTRLCKAALQKIDATQMVKLTDCLHNAETPPSPSTVKPDKDTELFFDRTTPTFQCSLSFEGSEEGKSKCMMRYQKEDIFSAYFTGKRSTDPTDKKLKISKPVIHFSCSEHGRFGMKIEDVYFHSNKTPISKWYRMFQKHLPKNADFLLNFVTQMDSDFQFGHPTEVYFDVKTVSTIGNYYYEMMDETWMKDFWLAATAKPKLTDVEIFTGTVKVMEAHRVVLSARSPVMNAVFNKMRNTGKSTFTFDEEFDVEIVKCFVKFLYTGTLETSGKKSIDYKKLLKLATMYEMETLKNMCQLANNVPDVEQFTNRLLEL